MSHLKTSCAMGSSFSALVSGLALPASRFLAKIDPVEAKRAEKLARREEVKRTKTFKECAVQWHRENEPRWTNAPSCRQALARLALHIFPEIGDLPVASIDTSHMLRTLKAGDFWTRTPQAAQRTLGLVRQVLAWAKVNGFRTGDNPADLDQLREGLPAQKKAEAKAHHSALDWRAVPAFMAELRQRSGLGARALELTILTGLRTNECLGSSEPNSHCRS